MNEETQINEQPQEEQVSLDGVEIVSNGAKIDTDVSTKVEDEQDTQPEENKQEQPQETPAEQKAVEEAKAQVEEVKQDLASKGVDFEKLQDEFYDKGELSKESYKLLEDAKYPKAVVDAMLKGWQASADAFANKVIDLTGGKREFQRVQKFIQEQGSSAIEAFNDIVERSDLNVVSAYITGIKAQMVAKYGTNNPTLGGGNASTGVSGYTDANEMVQAMSDPRYGKDIKYTKSVEDKVAKSTFF